MTTDATWFTGRHHASIARRFQTPVFQMAAIAIPRAHAVRTITHQTPTMPNVAAAQIASGTLSAVSDVEVLASNLANKIWQKIMILDTVARPGGA